jgi:hypothetical protein
VRFRLVSGNLTWGVRETTRSRTGKPSGSARNRPPSTTNVLLSHIPLGSLHCPLPPFASSQAALFYSTSHSFTVFFNFAFLCSIYWELALIYFKPGCRSQTSSILYFCIVRLITLISAATAHTNSVILTHILITRHRCLSRFIQRAEKLYPFLYLLGSGITTLSCTSFSDLNSTCKLQDTFYISSDPPLGGSDLVLYFFITLHKTSQR